MGETAGIHTFGRLPSRRVLLVGLGTTGRFSQEMARRAAGYAARGLDRIGAASAALEVFGADRLPPDDLARAMVEGIGLATYRFTTYRSGEQRDLLLDRVRLLGPEGAAIEDAVVTGEILVQATNYARDLANEPPNVLNPAELARRAETLAAAHGLIVDVFDTDEMARRGMDALLAVGRGSSNPPRLIVLQYRGDPQGTRPPLGLVGKGITFDTGGISLKPGPDMHIMKTDMGGAAAMFGAMRAIAELRPHLNVTMIVASAENMPDGNAFRPGDILRAMNGKTIEVQNTDAEGRLVLADALAYAVDLGCNPIVDAATLTGACTVALGPHYSGLFSNDDALRDRLLAATKRTGERLWPMPLDPDYRPLLDSSCADLRNVGGREGGAIIAATFLAEFVSSGAWAHLDIAPSAFADSETAYFAKNLATGYPVRTLAQLALDLAAEPA
jgi:leucyl aminopeptidase